MIQEKSCGAVVYVEDNGQRYYLIELMRMGHCSLCKGHVEGKETEHQTAAREIAEETGLTVEFIPGFRETIQYCPYENCQKTVVFFLARAFSRAVTVQLEEVREIAWLPYQEAMKALSYESDREVLRKANEYRG